MKPAFTPGPWVQCGRFGQEVRRYWPDDEQDLGGVDVICKVGQTYGGDRKANAHLSAAAPDMYEVVVRCREVYGKYGALVNEPFAPGELIAMIDAALAKANGETQ